MWFAHFLRTCLYKVVKTAVQLAFPPFSTNAYYGNGLASHTVKNLVNMRVRGFSKQFGRFTPFLFSCLFCQLFANFSKISREKFANFFKVWKAAARLGLRPFLCKILTSFYGLLPLNLPTFFTPSFYPGNYPVFPAYPG